MGGAYHGWSDQLAYGMRVPGTKGIMSKGVPNFVFKHTDEFFPNDLEDLERKLKANRLTGGTAAVYLEPMGVSRGAGDGRGRHGAAAHGLGHLLPGGVQPRPQVGHAVCKKNILKMGGAYHGWSDQLAYGMRVPGTKVEFVEQPRGGAAGVQKLDHPVPDLRHVAAQDGGAPGLEQVVVPVAVDVPPKSSGFVDNPDGVWYAGRRT